MSDAPRASDPMIADMFKARGAIEEHIRVNPMQRSGSIQCPICGTGTRQYSKAGNGHIWSRCTTKTCVAWME